MGAESGVDAAWTISIKTNFSGQRERIFGFPLNFADRNFNPHHGR